MPYQDLYILSRSEIDAVIEGHELDIRENFMLHRELTGVIIQPWLKKGSNVRMKTVMPFPWEQKPSQGISEKSIDKAKKLGEIVRAKRIKSRNDGGSKN